MEKCRTYLNVEEVKDYDVCQLMRKLVMSDISVEDYRNAFYQLGKALGGLLNKRTKGLYGNTMLACASEDADWLTQGVLDVLSSPKVSLAVFWNERIMLDPATSLEYSPIVKSYVEPIENCQTLILVKSIISTSCVVKIQLLRLMSSIMPQKIYVLAPVMYKDAESNLRSEFSADIADKFEFLTFAIDSERTSEGVVPGVGGMVYPKLGLGDGHGKNKYMPALVKNRLALV